RIDRIEVGGIYDVPGLGPARRGAVEESARRLVSATAQALRIRQRARCSNGNRYPRNRQWSAFRACGVRVLDLRPEDLMFPTPKNALTPNTYAYESSPLVKPTGFREYDARWLLEKEINLMGVQALGIGLGTLIHELNVKPEIVTGHDFRSYSSAVKMALISGLITSGCKVYDIGLVITPMAYFAQFELNVPCVAMVTASH